MSKKNMLKKAVRMLEDGVLSRTEDIMVVARVVESGLYSREECDRLQDIVAARMKKDIDIDGIIRRGR